MGKNNVFNTTVFAEALRAHGRPIRVGDLHPNLSSGLTEQLQFYRLMAPFASCGFVDNARFNAVALRHKGGEFIGIYVGALALIARYAYSLLSDPDMFPSIGDAAAESIQPEVLEELRRPFDVGMCPQSRYLPRDPVRLRAAQHLAMGAYLILFFHEMAHLELCHLDLLMDQMGLAAHQEVSAMHLSEEVALLFRALEWDADNSSLMTSLKMWRYLCSALDYSAIAALGPARSWRVAAQLFFWVMDFVQPPNRRGVLAAHPSTTARLINAANMAEGHGFVPELSGGTYAKEDSLWPWVIKNNFCSQVLADVRADRSFGKVAHELSELEQKYQQIMERLVGYQEVRLRERGVFPREFPKR